MNEFCPRIIVGGYSKEYKVVSCKHWLSYLWMNLYKIMNEGAPCERTRLTFFCLCKKGFLFYDKGIDTCRGLQPSWVMSIVHYGICGDFFNCEIVFAKKNVVIPVRKLSFCLQSSFLFSERSFNSACIFVLDFN